MLCWSYASPYCCSISPGRLKISKSLKWNQLSNLHAVFTLPKHATVKKPLCSGCGMVTAVCFLSVPSLCILAVTSTVRIPACSNFILPQTSLSITGVHTKRRNCAYCSEIVEGQIRFEAGSKQLFLCPQIQFHAAWCTLFVHRILHFPWKWALGVISFAEPTG